MQFIVATCLLIICGIINEINCKPVKAFIESKPLNQLKGRWQRSVYPYGYQFNPVEPSNNVFDHLPSLHNDMPELPISPFQVFRDLYPVPKALPYHKRNHVFAPTYDADFDHIDIPRLTPEDNYNKYLAALANRYPQQLPERNVITQNFFTTNIFNGYGLPNYPFPNVAETDLLNMVSKMPDTMFEEPQLLKEIPNDSKKQQSIILITLSPETLESESTDSPTEEVRELIKAEKKQAEDESMYSIHPLVVGEHFPENETYSVDEPLTTVKDLNSIIYIGEIPTDDDESNATTTEGTSTVEDESNDTTTEGTSTDEDDSNSTTEETPTGEDESNSIITEETPTSEDELNSMTEESLSSSSEVFNFDG